MKDKSFDHITADNSATGLYKMGEGNDNMNALLYATDECVGAVDRVVNEASVSESRILLKGFDVGDAMELKNSTIKCQIPRMAMSVLWIGQTVAFEKLMKFELKTEQGTGLVYRFLTHTYTKSEGQEWEARTDDAVKEYRHFLTRYKLALRPYEDLWLNLISAAVIASSVIPTAVRAACEGGTSSQAEQSTPDPPASATPRQSSEKKQPLAKEEDIPGFTLEPIELPPTLQREEDARLRWEAETKFVIPSPYTTGEGELADSADGVLNRTIAFFDGLATFGSPKSKQDTDSFIRMLSVKASLQVKTIANAMAAADETAALLMEAIETYGLRSFQNFSPKTRASLVLVRMGQQYDQDLWSWDAKRQEIVARSSLESAQAAVRVVNTSFLTSVQGYLAARNVALDDLGDRLGGEVGRLLNETELLLSTKSKKRPRSVGGSANDAMAVDAMAEDEDDEDGNEATGATGSTGAISLNTFKTLSGEVKTRVSKCLDSNGFFTTNADMPSGAATNHEAFMVLEEYGLCIFLTFRTPYAKLADQLFEMSSFGQEVGDASWTVCIKPPFNGLAAQSMDNALVKVGRSPAVGIPTSGVMVDGNRDIRKKVATMIKLVTLLVVALGRKDVLMNNEHEINPLLDFARQLIKFGTASKINNKPAARGSKAPEGSQAPSSETPELQLARAFCQTAGNLGRLHMFIWNMAIDVRVKQLESNIAAMDPPSAGGAGPSSAGPSSSGPSSSAGATAGSSANDCVEIFRKTFLKVSVDNFELPDKKEEEGEDDE